MSLEDLEKTLYGAEGGNKVDKKSQVLESIKNSRMVIVLVFKGKWAMLDCGGTMNSNTLQKNHR